MGDIVDKKNGRLKRLGKDGDRLFVEYWDQQGQLQTARLTTVIMYRSHHRNDKQPQNSPWIFGKATTSENHATLTIHPPAKLAGAPSVSSLRCFAEN